MSQTFNCKGYLVILLICSYANNIWGNGFSNSSNSIYILQTIFPSSGHQSFLTGDTIKENCPQLYASEDGNKIPGSLLALPKSCPRNNPEEKLCLLAIQFSSYLCNMSSSSHSQQKNDFPAPVNITAEQTPDFVCKALVDNELVSKLTAYSKKYLDQLAISNLSSTVTSGFLFPQNCNELCKDESNLFCQIILLNLKTLIKWKEEQETCIQEITQTAEQKTYSTVNNMQVTHPASHSTTPNSKEPHSNNEKGKSATVASTKSSDITPAITQKHESRSKHVTKAPGHVTKKPKATTTIMKEITTENIYQLEKPKGSAEDPAIDTKYQSEDDDGVGMGNLDEQATSRPAIEAEPHSHDADRYIDEPEDTHFLFYFISFASLSVCGYVAYMKRKRIIAFIIEGRGQPSSSRRRSGSSRERSGSYRKLINNLEEVITSQSVKQSNVIY